MSSLGTSSVDNIFNGLAKAEIFGSGNYFNEEGIFIVELQDIFCQDGFNGIAMIAEFRVLKSNNPDVSIGSARSVVYKKENKYFLANVKKLMLSLMGYEPTRENFSSVSVGEEVALITRAVMQSDTAKAEMAAKGVPFDPNMFKGATLRVECVKKEMKPSPKHPNGGTRIDTNWSPMSDG